MTPEHHNPPPVDHSRDSPRRRSYPEVLRIGEILRKETVGGILLVAAALIAIVWANSPWADSYFALRNYEVGYEPWHLRLSLGKWAADGLLAIFFFLVGLELKREFVAGDLRNPRHAMVPVAAAVGGVVVPAGIYCCSTQAAKPWAGGPSPQPRTSPSRWQSSPSSAPICRRRSDCSS